MMLKFIILNSEDQKFITEISKVLKYLFNNLIFVYTQTNKITLIPVIFIIVIKISYKSMS